MQSLAEYTHSINNGQNTPFTLYYPYMSTAVFAAGCFWGVEQIFAAMSGVQKTRVGYMGGHTANPTYEEVCTDTTGHAEVVKVWFDETQISYETLVEKFFALHDPTQRNRQGVDIGSQYRSEIFTHDSEQEQIAQGILQKIQTKYSKPIATRITSESPFYDAEEYHQEYFKKHNITCHI